jgi:hypothetical protein
MDIPQIIYEQGMEFDDETQYERFITYCEWYIFDTDNTMINDIPQEECSIFKHLCYLFIEPNWNLRQTKQYCELND